MGSSQWILWSQWIRYNNEEKEVRFEWLNSIERQNKLKKDPLYIVKPEAGAQGRGIFITKKVSDIPSYKKCVVQEYIQNPFLIDGFKFDLRIFVLVTRVEPLWIYIYKEGIARFWTEKYDSKVIDKEDEKSSYIHLTNFSINKKNKDIENEEEKESESKEDGNNWSILLVQILKKMKYNLGLK